jgi:hypothetical protein
MFKIEQLTHIAGDGAKIDEGWTGRLRGLVQELDRMAGYETLLKAQSYRSFP